MIAQYKHDMQLVDQLTTDAEPHYEIEQELYKKYEVKRGLRDLDGKGVRAGLTTISKVSATQIVDGREVPAAGQLLYRGIPIEQLVQGFITHDRFGFEEIVYLLLMGHLPKADQLAQFKGLLTDYQELPNHFNSGVIMKMPSDNIMNTMAKCVLALHAYDPKPDDTSLPNVMRQCIQLVSQFPSLAVFGYLARKGKEPSAPRKIGIGMMIAVCGFLIMAIGSIGLPTPDALAASGIEKDALVSPNWLISTYLVLTFAELFLSPMGISFVSKVAPPKYKGMMMGGWFAATAIGNYLVAIIGYLWGGMQLWMVWSVLIVCCLLAALFIFSIMKKLEKVA